MTVGGTKPSYNVDIYSGNHPFYQGGKTNAVMDEGMVSSYALGFTFRGYNFLLSHIIDINMTTSNPMPLYFTVEQVQETVRR